MLNYPRLASHTLAFVCYLAYDVYTCHGFKCPDQIFNRCIHLDQTFQKSQTWIGTVVQSELFYFCLAEVEAAGKIEVVVSGLHRQQ